MLFLKFEEHAPPTRECGADPQSGLRRPAHKRADIAREAGRYRSWSRRRFAPRLRESATDIQPVCAIVLCGSLVIPTVVAPRLRASSRTALVSVDSPDCEIPTTSTSRRSSGLSYNVRIEGAASDTGILVVISIRYRPNCAALSEVPRATMTISRGRCASRWRRNSQTLASRLQCLTQRLRVAVASLRAFSTWYGIVSAERSHPAPGDGRRRTRRFEKLPRDGSLGLA